MASDWPARGEIEFLSVTLVYLPNLPPALRDLSFNICAGEQVRYIFPVYFLMSSIQPQPNSPSDWVCLKMSLKVLDGATHTGE